MFAPFTAAASTSIHLNESYMYTDTDTDTETHTPVEVEVRARRQGGSARFLLRIHELVCRTNLPHSSQIRDHVARKVLELTQILYSRTLSKETSYTVKRDLLYFQKRPTISS
jgi:hypothetical protein